MAVAAPSLDEHALRRLLDVGRSLACELELETVLDRLLRAAVEVTGARYAALGILDARGEQLVRFVTLGADAGVRRAVGGPPIGRGVLGVLIADPRPLRNDSLAGDPRAAGFPAGHPLMDSFLGVPILVGGVVWGTLYLADKRGGERFTGSDEDALVVLADWAAVTVTNARLYEAAEQRSSELAGAVRRLEATTAVALAVGGEADIDAILRLIVRHGQALVGARAVAILLRDDDGLVVAAEAGELPPGIHGARVAADAAGARASLDGLGVAASDALLVPLVFRGRSLGMLAAVGCAGGKEDEQLLRSFAASAGTAVVGARSVEERRLREAMRAAEAERRRWARELHDATLQDLGALRLLLVGARRSGDGERTRGAVDDAIERLEGQIDALRGVIRELRPAALDDLGLDAALEGLAERILQREGIAVVTDVRVAGPRLSPELETGLYRVVQEALNNVIRHAAAKRVVVSVTGEAGDVRLDIHDDGHGFDPSAATDGHGLEGIRERVAMFRGELEIESSAAGTHVSAVLPAPLVAAGR